MSSHSCIVYTRLPMRWWHWCAAAVAWIIEFSVVAWYAGKDWDYVYETLFTRQSVLLWVLFQEMTPVMVYFPVWEDEVYVDDADWNVEFGAIDEFAH